MADLPAQKNNAPPKFFLYKAILFAILISLLPLLSPQMPESINPTFLSSAWELLHLLLVGIAVSYGLFSRRNDGSDPDMDKHKESPFKSDANSYFARILQISSAYDEEESKSETWSSQCNRSDPVVVESKPLLLPVRSLKTSVQNWDSLRADEDSAMADSTAEKSFYNSIPPSPPPLPPQPNFRHGPLLSSNRGMNKNFKDELKDFSRNGEEILKKTEGLVHTMKVEEAQIPQQQKHQTENREKKKKKVGFMEKLIILSEDSESEGEDAEDREETVWNEVDKKADEFIAKFRQQIRLQRTESIKKLKGLKSH